MNKEIREWQEQAIGAIVEEYNRIACFLKEQTVFRACPLRITVDGPYSIGAYMEVSFSHWWETAQRKEKLEKNIEQLEKGGAA